MQKMHLHLPGRMHMHRPNWHTVRVHLNELVHDPRFWAALALVVLFGLMILSTFLSAGSSTRTETMNPFNPYWP